MKRMERKSGAVGLALICLGLGSILSSCAEPADTSVPTAIPPVSVACNLPACHVNKSGAYLFGYWTTSSCDQPYFGVKITGRGAVSCTVGGGCAGTFSSWADWYSGQATTKAPSGTYTLCAVIDLNGDWTDYERGAQSGDVLGTLNSVSLNGSTPAQAIFAFVQRP